MPGATPQALVVSMSKWRGSCAGSHLRSAARRRMEGWGAHSGGTTPSQYLPLAPLTIPPRPDMLLWPERMKTCLLGFGSVSVLASIGFCLLLRQEKGTLYGSAQILDLNY
ncbi:hypothetical protein V8G54_028788 [Vigna mungo]|uniref:Uncharacterized protein n=1 Tax=Vigna mungo TaxID=3915 RepID=A0AAQ3MSW5_VIGMU